MDDTESDPGRILRLTEAFGKVGYWRVDIAEQTLFWSREVFRIHDRPTEHGMPSLDDAIHFYHPDDVEMVQTAIAQATERGEPFEFHGARIVRPDGSIRRVYSHGEITRGEDGAPALIEGVFRDVTEEFELNETARAARARLDLLVASGVGIWDWDLETDSVIITRQLARMLGRGDRELVAHRDDFLLGIPESDRPLVEAALRQHLDAGKPYLLEHRAIRKDGSIIWLKSRGQAEFNEAGKPVRIVGWTEDTTESRAREILDRTIINSVPVLIWLKDRDNNILRLNQTSADTLGAAIEDIEGKNTYDLFGDMAAKYHRDDIEVIDSGKPKLGIIEAYTPVGREPGWIKTDKVPMEDDAGNITRLLAVSTDISELIRIESALRVSEERFQLAAEGAEVGIWDRPDIHADEEYWSDQFYKLIGYEPGEIKPAISTFRSLLHPDDLPKIIAAAERQMTARGPFRIECRMKHKTKGYRWFVGTGMAAFNENGEAVRMVGSINDIHDAKMAENLLIEANRELERFAYIASHDLQEPLRKVRQFSELLEMELGDGISENASTYLKFLADASQRMQMQVRGLLEYSRTGRTAISAEACNVKTIAEAAWDDLSEARRGVDAALEIDAPETVHADRKLLYQLLLNLLGNSLKYRSPQRPSQIRISTQAEADSTILEVADNGIGFAPEQADSLFRIFSRLHRKDEIPGAGIGLALCQRVMQLHDGVIEAFGTPGEGAIFRAEFPNPQD